MLKRPSLPELLCLVFVVFCVEASLAQRTTSKYVLQERTARATFSVLPDADLPPGPVTGTNGDNGVKLSALKQEGADLLLITEITAQKGYQLSYDLRAHLSGPMGMSQRLGPVASRKGGKIGLTLEDVRETGWYPGGEYELVMTVTTLGDIDCASGPPTPRLRGLLIASGGGALIGLAGIAYAATLRGKNREDYARYESGWEEGLPASETFNQQLQDISERQDAADLLTLGGAILTVAGGTVFALLANNNGRRSKTYQRFCTEGPATQVLLSTTEGGIGLRLQHRF